MVGSFVGTAQLGDMTLGGNLLHQSPTPQSVLAVVNP
jgi:hypothetical protein